MTKLRVYKSKVHVQFSIQIKKHFLYLDMLKPIIRFILLFNLTLCFGARTNAQTALDKYLSVRSRSFQPYNFFIEKKFLFNNPLTDTLSVQINSAPELQKTVDTGLKDRIYGIEIRNAGKPNLDSIFKVAALLPHLIYLKISDPFFDSDDQAVYELPASIQSLRNLQGIEFLATNKLDMPSAITSISVLKDLTFLSFEAYNHPLPSSILTLGNVHNVKLSSENIAGLDLNDVKWTTVELEGAAPKIGRDETALDKISQISTLTALEAKYLAVDDYSVFHKLNRLKTLSIWFSAISKDKKLFNQLNRLPNLENLTVDFNRDTTQQLDGLEQLTNLRSFSLIDCGSLEKNPADLQRIGALTRLEYLVLNRDNFTALPDIFGSLKFLKTVNLSSNGIKDLPAGLFLLPEVRQIDISNNRLTSIPQTPFT